MSPVHEISFKPLEPSDLPILKSWISSAHWQQWWNDPDEEIASIGRKIQGLDTTRPFFFYVDGKLVGYIQYWIVGHIPETDRIERYPWLAGLHPETVGIDLSIGGEANLGIGLGSAALRNFAMRLQALGYEDIIIDPHPQNSRAIRAYQKAGFKIILELENKYSEVLLLKFDT